MVNPELEDLYFALFDDRQEMNHLVLWTIHVKRSDVQPLIDETLEMELGTLVEMNNTLAELAAIKN